METNSIETKVCSCCGKELPVYNFKKGRWGHVSVCLDCEMLHRREKRAERHNANVKRIEDERAEKRQLCLADFTPRELMAELKRRGYEFTARYTEVHVINSKDI